MDLFDEDDGADLASLFVGALKILLIRPFFPTS